MRTRLTALAAICLLAGACAPKPEAPKPAATTPIAAAPKATESSAALVDDGRKPLKATLVGFYLAGKKPLKKGSKFKKGDVVAGITALGIENDLEAPFDGEIEEMLVHEGDPLEYGQPIATVKVGK